ncbi:hypothetical protein DESUT3_13010 [Desulfuromonas versatilis]|uniref:Uncharacterized protein n=1 Tax=Desulfuromonas versatilis TaxID=2802975 RepID=A0ABM8HUB5_9BACT|nr:hypothetical protein [Desulfuromonas versatilis]BCR04232.1 hypothetical protein DESUT3_13010 [Desulfuromonas versatilis]
MKRRTVCEFVRKAELWPLVDAWSGETGFRLWREEGDRRIYRKGAWLLTAPAFVEISQRQGRVRIEAWVKADFFLVLSLLSGRSAEAGIESGGLTAAVPRKRARAALNILLGRLGQKPIG